MRFFAGLRRLAGSENIDALRTYAEAFEPVSFGDRAHVQKTDQLTALDRFVDAVRPAPSSKHWTEMLSRKIVKDPTASGTEVQAMSDWFTKVGSSLPEVKRIIANSPRLSDQSDRADQSAKLTLTAREALRYLVTAEHPDREWQSETSEQLKKARQPSGLVQFTFLPAITQIPDRLSQSQCSGR